MPQVEHAGKPIVFPEITTFRELFPRTGERKSGIEAKVLKRLDAGDAWQEVSGYIDMHRSAGGSVNILELAPFVMEYIEKEMLRIAHDTIHFQIVNWDDGRALVLSCYNQIIGCRYLAIIDQESIPSECVATGGSATALELLGRSQKG